MGEYTPLLQSILEELGKANEYHKQMVALKRLQLIGEGKLEAEGIIDEDIIHEDCSEYIVCSEAAHSEGSSFRCNDCQIYTPDKEAKGQDE